VTETVPPERAALSWLLRRRFRIGQTHASLFAPKSGVTRRVAAAGLSAAKVAACLGAATLHVANPLGRNRALIRGALHLGALAELAGVGRIEPYGQSGEAGA
jgi:succinoglycan biosynthesis protein ExoM